MFTVQNKTEVLMCVGGGDISEGEKFLKHNNHPI